MNLNMVQLKLSEAWERKLPPIGFSLDYSGTALIAEKFPESQYYLRLLRPPEGSLEFAVLAYRSESHNHSTLKELIRNLTGELGLKLKIGKTSAIRIAEIDRRAREFVAGDGLSRKKWIATIIPSPDGGPYGLLVLFGIYIGINGNGKQIHPANHPIFRKLVSNFELRGSR
jgi:hypothetical protein